MNIHPLPTTSPFAPEGWTIRLLFERVGATCQCICVISLNEIDMCRISMTDLDGDSDAARLAAAEKARAWIDAYLTRETSSIGAELPHETAPTRASS